MERGILYVGGTYRFTVECFDAAGASIALDEAPTFVVVKNGTPTLDAVTPVDRNSDGKHYDCSYNPSGETETDHYEIRTTVTIAAVEYVRPSEHFDVVAPSPVDKTVLVSTTIATLASQTSFTLTAGSGDDDAYKNCFAIITDAASSLQKSVRRVVDYTGSTKTVTLERSPDFTIQADDLITIAARLGNNTFNNPFRSSIFGG